MAGGLPGATFPVTPAVSLQPIGDESQARVLHVVGDKPGGPHTGLGPQARGRGSWGLRLRWRLENSGCRGRWLHLPAPAGPGVVCGVISQFLFSRLTSSGLLTLSPLGMCPCVRLSVCLSLWRPCFGQSLMGFSSRLSVSPALSDSLSFPPSVSFSVFFLSLFHSFSASAFPSLPPS